jgi:hypothetical protein
MAPPFLPAFWDVMRHRLCLFCLVHSLFSLFSLFGDRSPSLTGTQGSPSTCKCEGWQSSDVAAACTSSQAQLEAPPLLHPLCRVALAITLIASPLGVFLFYDLVLADIRDEQVWVCAGVGACVGLGAGCSYIVT